MKQVNEHEFIVNQYEVGDVFTVPSHSVAEATFTIIDHSYQEFQYVLSKYREECGGGPIDLYYLEYGILNNDRAIRITGATRTVRNLIGYFANLFGYRTLSINEVRKLQRKIDVGQRPFFAKRS
jgi:hypothetical protein